MSNPSHEYSINRPYKCLNCGRTMARPTPHWCFKNYIKHKLNFEKIKTTLEGRIMTTNYIDLGLPSGNLWAETNEEGYYTYDKAVEKYGDNLPTKEDFGELLEHCYHKWEDEPTEIEIIAKTR